MRELQGFASPVLKKNLHPCFQLELCFSLLLILWSAPDNSVLKTRVVFFLTALASIAPILWHKALCSSFYLESVQAAGGCWRAYAPRAVRSSLVCITQASKSTRCASFGQSAASQSSLFRGLFFLVVPRKINKRGQQRQAGCSHRSSHHGFSRSGPSGFDENLHPLGSIFIQKP